MNRARVLNNSFVALEQSQDGKTWIAIDYGVIACGTPGTAVSVALMLNSYYAMIDPLMPIHPSSSLPNKVRFDDLLINGRMLRDLGVGDTMEVQHTHMGETSKLLITKVESKIYHLRRRKIRRKTPDIGLHGRRSILGSRRVVDDRRNNAAPERRKNDKDRRGRVFPYEGRRETLHRGRRNLQHPQTDVQ